MGLVETLDATAAFLAGRPRWVVLIVGLAGVALVGFFDWWTGVEWAFTLLYLLPITVVTWTAGEGAGLVVAAACAASWLFTDLLTHPSYEAPLSRYWDLLVEAGVFSFVTILLASLRQHLEAERSLARRDPLTGLANRRHFLELTARELSRCRRLKEPVTAVYVDLDDFKAVNDSRGHDAGDRVLARVAATLGASVRAVDVVARLGGDEFAVLLPGTGADTAEPLVDRLRQALNAVASEGGWPVAFSVGVVTFDSAPADVEWLLRHADRLMYEAKASGRGRVRFGRVGEGTTL
ncbi:MAG TPA: GGDEF domain-containing protein [Vicinamibacteria bacterium]|nr:GGDEF domain-containing protein [Vicinamibacteria bacterium]